MLGYSFTTVAQYLQHRPLDPRHLLSIKNPVNMLTITTNGKETTEEQSLIFINT